MIIDQNDIACSGDSNDYTKRKLLAEIWNSSLGGGGGHGGCSLRRRLSSSISSSSTLGLANPPLSAAAIPSPPPHIPVPSTEDTTTPPPPPLIALLFVEWGEKYWYDAHYDYLNAVVAGREPTLAWANIQAVEYCNTLEAVDPATPARFARWGEAARLA
ncbi:uncharacterized protein M421DRAFT_7356 [Didymella exigua CBS 183.55]|uniref:Uncharacterized protein n=1 Tax=Didymella exigua CBS 183.55 TaxID=1150837 RepID=A0A6A5RI68_9PLEO|nr:uncharacterized protein M421DRAFT_7356 [Didymella exigua CBS 183.55]KAF1926136.1 hypothetical protein M421DRAFT_7356 [Didymella exigua CBS 183.55]